MHALAAVQDCDVRPVDAARLKKKNGFEVKQDKVWARCAPLVRWSDVPWGGQGAQAVHTFYVDTAEEQQQWMSALLVATVPAKWPCACMRVSCGARAPR